MKTTPFSVLGTTNTMSLRFKTDSSDNFKGFQAFWSSASSEMTTNSNRYSSNSFTSNTNYIDSKKPTSSKTEITTNRNLESSETSAKVSTQTSSKYEMSTGTSSKFEQVTRTSSKYELVTRPPNKFEAFTRPSNKFDPFTRPSNKYEYFTRPSNKYEHFTRPSNKYEQFTRPSNKYEQFTKTTSKYEETKRTSLKYDEEISLTDSKYEQSTKTSLKSDLSTTTKVLETTTTKSHQEQNVVQSPNYPLPYPGKTDQVNEIQHDNKVNAYRIKSDIFRSGILDLLMRDKESRLPSSILTSWMMWNVEMIGLKLITRQNIAEKLLYLGALLVYQII